MTSEHQPKSDDLRKHLEFHLAEAARIRERLAEENYNVDWRPHGFYAMYHILTGIVLGGIGAGASLLWNILGATLLIPDKHPLHLIQVYLTFGLGEKALAPDANLAFELFVGCLLYLSTGALYGIVLQFILQGLFGRANWLVQLIIATILGLGLWAINFLVLLPWLQPLLFGGNWIADMVPPTVGISTHLVFVWAFMLFSAWGWGKFDVSRRYAYWASMQTARTETGYGERGGGDDASAASESASGAGLA